jgi:hypothetical protein
LHSGARRALIGAWMRKVIHPAARDNYRVVVRDGDDIETGSIGRQFDGWAWGIDCVIPMRETESAGSGSDLKDTACSNFARPGTASAQIRLA